MKKIFPILVLMISTLTADSNLVYETKFNSSLGSEWRTLKALGGFTPKLINERLRLTNRNHDLSTAVTLDYEFPTKDNKFVLEFDYYAYGGCYNNDNYVVKSNGAGRWGADGTAIILFDSSAGATPGVGASGGSLGYANGNIGMVNNVYIQQSGFEKAWLGIGLDEFGAFSNNSEDRRDINGNTNSRRYIDGDESPNSIVIRGDAINGYRLLKVKKNLNKAIARESVNKKGRLKDKANDSYYSGRYKLTVDSTKDDHLYIKLERKTSRDGAYQIVIGQFDAMDPRYHQGAKPKKFRLAFSSGTGGGCNKHEIDNVKVYGSGNAYNPTDPVHISIDDVSKLEGDGNTTEFLFTVSLDKVANRDVSFWYTVTDGSDGNQSEYAGAVQNAGDEYAEHDYIGSANYVTIPAGETKLILPVQVVGDLNVEPDERFFVDLYEQTDNAVIDDRRGEGIILNDDLPPVSEYRFDECTFENSKVVDAQGYADGIAKGGVLSSSDGKIKRAVNFTGKNYIDTGDSFNEIFGSTNNQFTITAWIKPSKLLDTKTNHNTKNTFIAKASDSKNDNLEIGVNPNGSLHLYLDTKGKDKYADFGSGITTDNWHFVAVSYDGDKVIVNIDGNNYENSSTWVNGGNVDQALGSPFTIGASLHIDNFFNGLVDEVKIYDVAFEGDTLNAIYLKDKNNNGFDRVTQTCMISEYRFDSCDWFGVENEVLDSVGVSHGISHDAFVSTDAKIIRSAEFKDSLIEINSNFSFVKRDFAVSFWIYPKKVPTAPVMAVMGKDIEVYLRKDGKLSVNLKNGENDLISDDSIVFNSWNHIVLSSDGKDIKLYINAKESGSASAEDLGVNGNDLFMIGKTSWSEGADANEVENFNGLIDELKIFDSAIDIAVISEIIQRDNNGENFNGSQRAELKCISPVGCKSEAIVIDDTKFVHEIDLVTGDKVTTIMSSEQINGASVNGFGFNVKDGYLWGSQMSRGGYLVRIGKDENGEYAQEKVGPIDGLPTSRGTYIGDVDHNGRLYLYYKDIPVKGTHTMFIINLDRQSRDYLKIIDSFTLGNITIADMSFNPIDKQLYAIENDNDLYKIDVDNKSITLLKKDAVNAKTDTFGSSFFDSAGFFYAIKNSARDVYRFDISDPSNIRSLKFSKLTNEDVQNVNIDGGRCNLKPIYIDYGDAPDNSSYSEGDGTAVLNYKTLTSDSGPRHSLPEDENISNVYFGASVGSESDAKVVNRDDDDGVVGRIKPLFTSMYSYDMTMRVKNDTNVSANAVGWIDFNRNGRFETKEGVSVYIPAKTDRNVIFRWNVPNDITDGTTYARFRVSTDELGINEEFSYGAKTDGEVEDWEIIIKRGTLYDVWDIDSNSDERVIKTKIVNKPIKLNVSSIDRTGVLKPSVFSDVKVGLFSKDDRTLLHSFVDINFSKSNPFTVDFGEINKAVKYAYVKISYTDETNKTKEINASDTFAIRPDRYEITIPTDLKAGKNFDINLVVKDVNGSVVTNYEAAKDNYLIDINETKKDASCVLDIEAQRENVDFVNGEANITVTYSDIGILDFKLYEKPGSEFAIIDNDDTPDNERYIKFAQKTSSEIKAAKIELIWELKNGDESNGYTYFNNYESNDSELSSMYASFDVAIKMKNTNGELLKNFSKGCYAKDVNLKIEYEVDSNDTDGYSLKASYQDMNDTFHTDLSKWDQNIVKGENIFNDYMIESSLFEKGKGIKKVKFNFERETTRPRNPMKFIVKDLNASLEQLSDTDSTDKTVTFLYARAHIPDQSIVGKEMDVKVYYEAYCKECDKALFGFEDLIESIDSINWYILENINEEYSDFNIGNGLTSNNSGENDNITSKYSLLKTNKTGSKSLRVETSKTPTIAKVTYTPKSYLVYNQFKNDATTHSFITRFTQQPKSWAGKGDLGLSVDMNVNSRNHFDKIDW